jgi:hypothetical protein
MVPIMAEDPLQQAERHVRQFEENVRRQRDILDEMERDKYPEAAERARAVLATYEESLRLGREHLGIERRERGFEP